MRASNRYFLPLAAGELHATLEPAPKQLVIAFRQFSNQVFRIALHCGGANLENIARGFNPSHADIFGGRHVIAHEILKDSSDLVPQRVQVIIAKIDAIQENFAFRWVIEPGEKLGERRFSLPVFPDQRNPLVWLDHEINAAQNRLGIPGIREGNISKLDSAPNRPRRQNRSRPRSNSWLHSEEVQQVSHEQSLVRNAGERGEECLYV